MASLLGPGREGGIPPILAPLVGRYVDFTLNPAAIAADYSGVGAEMFDLYAGAFTEQYAGHLLGFEFSPNPNWMEDLRALEV
jgi:hypothetical protein